MGYMLSAARKRKGIWSSALQLTGVSCVWFVFGWFGLGFCVCALPACSFQQQNLLPLSWPRLVPLIV